MNSRDFAYWCQGYFELRRKEAKDLAAKTDMPVPMLELGPLVTACIQNHLNMVFKHDIDPSNGDVEHQAELSRLHEGGTPKKDEQQSTFEALLASIKLPPGSEHLAPATAEELAGYLVDPTTRPYGDQFVYMARMLAASYLADIRLRRATAGGGSPAQPPKPLSVPTAPARKHRCRYVPPTRYNC